MADANLNFYKTNASMLAEEKVNANKGSKRKKSKLANLLTLWVTNIFLISVFVDIFYLSSSGEDYLIILDLSIIGYGVAVAIILLMTAKDLAIEIRKLFQ